MKNTDMITHVAPWGFPERAILAAYNGRISSALSGQRAPSRSLLLF